MLLFKFLEGSGYVISSPSYVPAHVGIAQVSKNWSVTHSSITPIGLVECEAADLCVVVVGSFSHEGDDRKSLKLGVNDSLLVDGVIALKKPALLVVQSAAPVLLPFLNKFSAVVVAGFAGQEFGNALADIVSGAVNPSGRLAMTWPVTESQEIFAPNVRFFSFFVLFCFVLFCFFFFLPICFFLIRSNGPACQQKIHVSTSVRRSVLTQTFMRHLIRKDHFLGIATTTFINSSPFFLLGLAFHTRNFNGQISAFLQRRVKF